VTLFWLGLCILLSVPVGMTVFLVGMFFYLIRTYIHLVVRIFQEKPLFIVPRGERPAGAEDVRFPTSDGLTLQGCYLRTTAPRRRGVILFGLEFGSNRWACVPYTEFLVANGFDVQSCELKGWWIDTGKMEDLLDANRLVLQSIGRDIQGSISDDCVLQGNVVVGSGAVVCASTLRGPLVIGSNSRIEHSYVGPFSAVGDNCVIRRSELEHSIVMEGTQILDVPVRIEDSLIGRDAIVNRRELALTLHDEVRRAGLACELRHAPHLQIADAESHQPRQDLVLDDRVNRNPGIARVMGEMIKSERAALVDAIGENHQRAPPRLLLKLVEHLDRAVVEMRLSDRLDAIDRRSR